MVDTYSGRYGSGVVREAAFPWLNPENRREYSATDHYAELYGINPVTAEHLENRWNIGTSENLQRGMLKHIQRAVYLMHIHQAMTGWHRVPAGQSEYEDGTTKQFFKNVESVL